MIITINFRNFSLLFILACCLVLGAGFILEHFFFLLPCPLCTLQRLCYTAIGLIFCVAAVHNPKGVGKIYYLIISLAIMVLGLFVAAWQVYLQLFVSGEHLSCSAGFFELLAANNMLSFISELFTANADCSDTSFTLLGLTIAGWSLLLFVLFTVINVVALTKAINRKWDHKAPLC